MWRVGEVDPIGWTTGPGLFVGFSAAPIPDVTLRTALSAAVVGMWAVGNLAREAR